MISLPELIPAPSTRSVIVGKTGEGKTTLAYTILDAWESEPARYDGKGRCTVVIDPKGTFKYDGDLIRSPEQLNGLRSRRIIYRPGFDSDVKAELELILRAVYQHGNIDLYIDEVYGCHNGDEQYPGAMGALWTRGREMGIRIAAAMQRPCRVPRFIVTETEYQYVFRLLTKDDRERMREIMGDSAMVLPEKHAFWFNNVDSDRGPVQCRLELGGFDL